MRTATRICIALCALGIAIQPLYAQDDAAKKEEYGWKNSAVIGANLTQVSLTNWTKGGENTLVFMVFSKNAFNLHEALYDWKNTIRLMYGQSKIGNADFQKSDDEIFLESMHSRNIGWVVNPFAAVQVRTQFAPGYKNVTTDNGVDSSVQISDFWDPGYIIESFGFSYASGPEFSTRLGVGFKETFSKKYGYAHDPSVANDDATFRFETGIESSSKLVYDVMENMKLTSQLDLFSAFNKLDVWDVRWESDITGKVNDYVNVSLNVILVHEIAQTRKTQVKQTLALGFSYAIL